MRLNKTIKTSLSAALYLSCALGAMDFLCAPGDPSSITTPFPTKEEEFVKKQGGARGKVKTLKRKTFDAVVLKRIRSKCKKYLKKVNAQISRLETRESNQSIGQWQTKQLTAAKKLRDHLQGVLTVSKDLENMVKIVSQEKSVQRSAQKAVHKQEKLSGMTANLSENYDSGHDSDGSKKK